jgi:hypothetical protein
MLPSLVVIHYLAVATDVLDEVVTVGFMVGSQRHTQHLSVLEFGRIPRYFMIHIHDLNVQETGTE